MITWILLIAAAYVAGSIPFGYIIGRLKGLDIREHGSRNVGATNVGRVLGKKLGILCFGLDATKGAGPVMVAGVVMGVWGRSASAIGAEAMAWWLGVAFAALIGHMASPWLGFRGGKGVATGFGALVAMWPVMTVPALIALGLWIMLVLVFRFVSVASIVAALSLPVSAWIANDVGQPGERSAALWLLVTVSAVLAALVTWKHRANLRRLWRGEEPRVGRKSKNAQA